MQESMKDIRGGGSGLSSECPTEEEYLSRKIPIPEIGKNGMYLGGS